MVFNPYLNRNAFQARQNNNSAPPAAGNAARPGAGRGGDNGGSEGAYPPGLPNDYLKGGYFTSDKNIRPELLLRHAEQIAHNIGRERDSITNAQLRRFYGHVRSADTRLRYGVPFDTVRSSILELKSFAAEARGKGKVPEIFKQFIDMNLACVVNEDTFCYGFVKHFQAVVGYFSYIYPRK